MKFPSLPTSNDIDRLLARALLSLARIWCFRASLVATGTPIVTTLVALFYAPHTTLCLLGGAAASIIGAAVGYVLINQGRLNFEQFLIENVSQPRPGEEYRARVRVLLRVKQVRYDNAYTTLEDSIAALTRAIEADATGSRDPQVIARKKRCSERRRKLRKELDKLTRSYAKTKADFRELLHISAGKEGGLAIEREEATSSALLEQHDHVSATVEVEDVLALPGDAGSEKPPEREEPVLARERYEED